MSAETASSDVLNTAGSGDALLGMAALGKTAAALALVIGLILVCTLLLKRWNTRFASQSGHVRVISSTAVGSRERVVVVEVEDTWLVLGVGQGRVTPLHERPAPPPSSPAESASTGFSTRFARALNRRSRSADSTSHHTP